MSKESKKSKESYLLTIIAIAHGVIIPLETSDEKLRIFSESGDFCEIEMSKARENAAMKKSTETFRTDFPTESSLPVLQSYIDSHMHNRETSRRRIHHNITYDKIFTLEAPSILDGWFGHEAGIFLISVHRKEADTWKFIPNIPVINLMKLDQLRRIDSSDTDTDTIIERFVSNSAILESYADRKRVIDERTDQHDQLVKQLNANFKQELFDWKLHVQGNRVLAIKMSFLFGCLRSIFGASTYINLLDYSCSDVSSEMSIPVPSFSPSDIKEFGGKSSKKTNRKMNRKSKRKTNRKSKRKSKRKTNRKL